MSKVAFAPHTKREAQKHPCTAAHITSAKSQSLVELQCLPHCVVLCSGFAFDTSANHQLHGLHGSLRSLRSLRSTCQGGCLGKVLRHFHHFHHLGHFLSHLGHLGTCRLPAGAKGDRREPQGRSHGPRTLFRHGGCWYRYFTCDALSHSSSEVTDMGSMDLTGKVEATRTTSFVLIHPGIVGLCYYCTTNTIIRSLLDAHQTSSTASWPAQTVPCCTICHACAWSSACRQTGEFQGMLRSTNWCRNGLAIQCASSMKRCVSEYKIENISKTSYLKIISDIYSTTDLKFLHNIWVEAGSPGTGDPNDPSPSQTCGPGSWQEFAMGIGIWAVQKCWDYVRKWVRKWVRNWVRNWVRKWVRNWYRKLGHFQYPRESLPLQMELLWQSASGETPSGCHPWRFDFKTLISLWGNLREINKNGGFRFVIGVPQVILQLLDWDVHDLNHPLLGSPMAMESPKVLDLRKPAPSPLLSDIHPHMGPALDGITTHRSSCNRNPMVTGYTVKTWPWQITTGKPDKPIFFFPRVRR